MGEIAEMMLDGTLCSQCGEYLGTDNGFASLCGGCADDAWGDYEPEPTAEKPCKCSNCSRSFGDAQALAQHMRDKHGVKPIECPGCGKRVANLMGLQQHMDAKGCRRE